MNKEDYICEINRLLGECADVDLIELIYQIMLKSSSKD